jgi:hypothetical protein
LLHERSHALYAALGDSIGMARALTYAGITAYWQGDYARYVDFTQQCMVLQSGVGDVLSMTYSREVQGMAFKGDNPNEQAVIFFAAAEVLRQAIGAPLAATDSQEYIVCQSCAVAALPPATYASAWQRGGAMRLDELVQMCDELS